MRFQSSPELWHNQIMDTAKSTSTRFTPAGLMAIVLLAIAVMAMTLIAAKPSVRNALRTFFMGEGRQIIAKTGGYIRPEGPQVTVLKIKDGDQLVVEVYNVQEQSAETRMIARIVLPENRDGYFQFQGNATNLAISDTDGDGSMDIIAPTFDDQMVARLNIYRYNKDTGTFDRRTSDELPPGTNH